MVFKGAVPPPTVPTTPTPTTSPLKFSVDLVGWIPQPEVDNPLQFLPSIVQSMLPANMCDPFFGGDNFATPSLAPSGMAAHTFRAKQSLSFEVPKWGDAPASIAKSAKPGLTVCLDKRRAAGGKVTFSLTATVKNHTETVTY